MLSLEVRKAQRAKAREAQKAGVEVADVEDKDILEGSIASIKAALEGMSAEQLDAVAEREDAGKKRVSVADAIAKAKAKLQAAPQGWQGNS